MEKSRSSGGKDINAWINGDGSRKWETLHRRCSELWRSEEAQRLNVEAL